MSSFIARYAAKLIGVISCFDRLLITGTIPGWCYAEGMSKYLFSQGIRIFDYAQKFAEPLREEIRANAERVAAKHGLTIEFIDRIRAFRKEARIKAILKQRGTHPGLVHIFSAMEKCTSFRPWHDKHTHQTALRCKASKCLHYYFYFIDPEFGLCYLRVPTWAPFNLQFYCNGHAWLANKMQARGIKFTQIDNAFVSISDPERAQALANNFPVARLHRLLQNAAKRYCPPLRLVTPCDCHWSLTQVEYATDIMFKNSEDLKPLYDSLVHAAIYAVKPEHIAMFFGKKLDGRTTTELGTDFTTRSQGTRLKHYLGWALIKMYDKFCRILRIETTVNDVSKFQHYRTVEHRDGTTEHKYAAMKKTIYSLPALQELLLAANSRYLEFLSDLENPSEGKQKLAKLCASQKCNGRSFRGFNFFKQSELDGLLALLRGEGCIYGITNRMLRRVLPNKTSAQISYFLKRCRIFKLLKKCGNSYKYYLTETGRRTLLFARRLQEFLIIPTLAGQKCT